MNYQDHIIIRTVLVEVIGIIFGCISPLTSFEITKHRFAVIHTDGYGIWSA